MYQHRWVEIRTASILLLTSLLLRGPATVEFWGTRGRLDARAELVDSIVITQVPELATLALLGLGVLFVRRERICSE